MIETGPIDVAARLDTAHRAVLDALPPELLAKLKPPEAGKTETVK